MNPATLEADPLDVLLATDFDDWTVQSTAVGKSKAKVEFTSVETE